MAKSDPMPWNAVLGLLLVASCAPPTPAKEPLIAKWKQMRPQYEEIVRLCRADKGLNSILLTDKEMAIDERAWVEKGKVLRVSFLQAKWGIDNSYWIVYQDPESPLPEFTDVIEKWFRVEKLAPNWFLVEGT